VSFNLSWVHFKLNLVITHNAQIECFFYYLLVARTTFLISFLSQTFDTVYDYWNELLFTPESNESYYVMGSKGKMT